MRTCHRQTPSGVLRAWGIGLLALVLLGALVVSGVPVKRSATLDRSQNLLQAEQDWRSSGLNRLLGTKIYDYPRPIFRVLNRRVEVSPGQEVGSETLRETPAVYYFPESGGRLMAGQMHTVALVDFGALQPTDHETPVDELRSRPYRVMWLVNNVEPEDFPNPDKARRALRAVPFSSLTAWLSPGDLTDHRLALMVIRQDGIVSKRRGAELIEKFGSKAVPPADSAAAVIVNGGSRILESMPGAHELSPQELERLKQRERQIAGQPIDLRVFQYLEELSPRRPWVPKPLPKGMKPHPKVIKEEDIPDDPSLPEVVRQQRRKLQEARRRRHQNLAEGKDALGGVEHVGDDPTSDRPPQVQAVLHFRAFYQDPADLLAEAMAEAERRNAEAMQEAARNHRHDEL